MDRYGRVHSQLICTSITLGSPTCHQLASREILIEQNIKKRTGPVLWLLRAPHHSHTHFSPLPIFLANEKDRNWCAYIHSLVYLYIHTGVQSGSRQEICQTANEDLAFFLNDVWSMFKQFTNNNSTQLIGRFKFWPLPIGLPLKGRICFAILNFGDLGIFFHYLSEHI